MSSTSPAHSPRSSSSVAVRAGLVADVQQRDAQRTQQQHALAVQSMFGRIAGTYDRLNRWLSMGIDRSWRRRACDALARRLPASGPIADICAGTLDIASALQTRFGEREVLCLDFALPMLVRGRHKVRPETACIASDAMRLPLADSSVAGITCGFGIRNVARPSSAVAEMFRVLQPGGVLVVLEFFQPTRAITKLFHAVYGRAVIPALGKAISGDDEAYAYLSESMKRFLTGAEFQSLLEQQGFAEVEVRELTLGVVSLVRAVKPQHVGP
jgi:demethylmenaquinone methyltransferase/2-methoxy-6-polyprenyl-1,4-benzoquinol methylase